MLADPEDLRYSDFILSSDSEMNRPLSEEEVAVSGFMIKPFFLPDVILVARKVQNR